MRRDVRPDPVNRISFTALCRGYEDAVEIHHHADSDGVADVAITLRDLRDETIAPMPFDTWERSLSAGRPVRLYEFIRGAMRWLGTGADRDITWDGRVFRAAALRDDGARQSGDLNADTLTVTVPADWPPAVLYRLRRPATAVAVAAAIVLGWVFAQVR